MNTIALVSNLYELALNIGNDKDLHKMMSDFCKSLSQKLSANELRVYLQIKEPLVEFLVIPTKNREDDNFFELAKQTFEKKESNSVFKENVLYLNFYIEKKGVIVIKKVLYSTMEEEEKKAQKDKIIKAQTIQYIRGLNTIMKKLSQAISSCNAYEEIERQKNEIAKIEKEKLQAIYEKKLAFQQGLYESASSYLHNIKNIATMINGKLIILDDVIATINSINSTLNSNSKKEIIELYPEIKEAVEEFIIPQLEDLNQDMQKNMSRMITTIRYQQSEYKLNNRREHKVKKQFKLRKLIVDLIKDFKMEIVKHSIKTEINIDANLTLFYQKNPFYHGLINIIKNAIEAIEEHPEITNPKIMFNAYENSKFIVLEIEDNGIGINNEETNSIFNAGFTTKEDGHGLGLHSFSTFLLENRASIKAYSEGANRGSKFVIKIQKEF